MDIYKLIEQHKVISFDIFDTLINRVVEHPTDVFSIVSYMYHERFSDNMGIPNFKDERICAERNARKNKKSEITLDDIYNELSLKFSEEIILKYKQLELEAEERLCIRNRELFDVYEYCLRQKKRIIIISDMYLPQEEIKKLLHLNGYEGYDSLYLSSAIGLTKAEGELFSYCLKEEEIHPRQLLHIGDNKKSDVVIPRLKGISSYQVKASRNSRLYNGLLEGDKSLEVFINKTAPSFNNEYERIGYECFGPLLYGFVSWIIEETRNKYDKVFFLSRDGYIMKKAYDFLINSNDGKDCYMYASRRALHVAMIHFQPEFDVVMSQMFIPRSVDVAWLLRKWGLNEENCIQEVRLAGLEINERIFCKELKSNVKVRKLYEQLKQRVIDNSIEEYNAFIKYIEKIGLSGDVAIVDIGWYGNMQNSLEQLIKKAGIDANITGLYLGVVPGTKYFDMYKMKGYLFQKNRNEALFYKMKYLNSMLELFFMAPHGTANNYALNENGVVLGDFEFKNSNTKTIVDYIQKSAFLFLENITQKYYYSNNNPCIYFNPLYSTLIRPSLKVAYDMGKLEIWDGKWIKMATKRNMFWCIFNIHEFINEFINTPWKMGYLKQILRIPLKYDRIVFFLRRKFKPDAE